MRTDESIYAKGQSCDVYVGTTAECKEEAKLFFQNQYNTHIEPFVRDLGTVEIEGEKYALFESYIDSGSDDYYYFSIKSNA